MMSLGCRNKKEREKERRKGTGKGEEGAAASVFM